MTFSSTSTRRRIAGALAGSLFGGMAAAVIVAPTASAAPEQCTASAVSNTVSSVTGQARDYLAGHPGANQVLTAAANQPRAEASANVRSYFTANPNEYYELRNIVAPIGDVQRQCNVTVLPPDLASAYDEFMAG
ncbi:heme-binding protein [Mycolicibacterium thermoresistibile]